MIKAEFMRAIRFLTLVGASIMLAAGPSARGAQSDIYVDQARGVNSASTVGSEGSPFKSISYAIQIMAGRGAPDPWVMHVGPGVYDSNPAKPFNEREAFPIQMRSAMVLVGVDGPEVCILNGEYNPASAVPLVHGEDLEGITLAGLKLANMYRAGGSLNGAACELVRCSGTIDGCVFEGNHARNGGALWISLAGDQEIQIRDSLFQGNVAETAEFYDGSGGAVAVDGAFSGEIAGNVFVGNQSFSSNVYGGGLFVSEHFRGGLSRNTFIANRVIGSFGYGGGAAIRGDFQGNAIDNTFLGNAVEANFGYGGGMMVYGAFAGEIAGNTFSGNSVFFTGSSFSYGGGLYIDETAAGAITRNLFSGNSVDAGGGGLNLNQPGELNVIVSNNYFLYNRIKGSLYSTFGANLYTDQNTTLINNTFYGGVGPETAVFFGGMAMGSYIQNNVFARLNSAVWVDGVIENARVTHNDFDNLTNVPALNYTWASGLVGEDAERGVWASGQMLRTRGTEELFYFDSASHTSILTAADKAWASGSKRGMLLNISKVQGQRLHVPILGNTDTRLIVRGNLLVLDLIEPGGAFSIDNYHLSEDSQNIDAGKAVANESDFEGDTRPFGSAYDVGADEFVIMPEPEFPANPNPADGAVNVPLDVVLRWDATPYATHYSVYFWKSSEPEPDGPAAEGLTVPQFAPNVALEPQTEYSWMVAAINETGMAEGDVWTFATKSMGNPPAEPSVPSPPNGATGVSVSTDFDWADSAGATTYDFYLWKSAETKPGSPVAADLTTSRYEPFFDLALATSYTWQVVAKNAYGSAPGPLWLLATRSAPPDKPSAPAPASGASGVAKDATLDWADSARALSYDLYLWRTAQQSKPLTPTAAGLSASQYAPPFSFSAGTSYSWQVVALGSGGSTPGDTWQFQTEAGVPDPPASPAPADGARGVAVGAALDWADSAGASAYDLYLWKSAQAKPASPTAPGLTQSAYAPPFSLSRATSYTWQVIARNASGTSAGPLWSFWTEIGPPSAPASPAPSNGATNVSATTNFDWSDATGAERYDFYIWKTGSAKPAVPTVPGLVSSDYAPFFELDLATTYSWQVIAVNASGSTPSGTWSFATSASGPNNPPGAPGVVRPADGATSVSVDAILEWTTAQFATSYDVYLWRSDASKPLLPTASDLRQTTYQPASALTLDTTYSWQVVARNAQGSTPGSVWSFATVSTSHSNPPSRPSNLEPLPGATDVSLTPTLRSSAFADADAGDAHGASWWQVRAASSATDYSKAAFDSGLTASGLVAHAVPSGKLAFSTRYFWRVAHQDDHGVLSAWSPETDFTTTDEPSGNLPAAPSDLQAYGGVDSIRLVWKANTEKDLAGYRVYARHPVDEHWTSLTPSAISNTGMTHRDLKRDDQWQYVVTAVNTEGSESPYSNVANATVGAIVAFTHDIRGKEGTSITIPVNISFANGISDRTGDVEMRFPSDLLRFSHIVNTVLTEGWVITGNERQAGLIDLIVVAADPKQAFTMTGEGRIVELVFDVIGSTGGASGAISFDVVKLYDKEGKRLNVDFSDTSLFTVAQDYIRGDLNGDGDVDSMDVAIAMDIAVGRRVPTTRQTYAGDINGDTVIDSADVALIIDLAVGRPINPSAREGELRRAALRSQSRQALARDYIVEVASVEGAPGQTVAVPITLNDATNFSGCDLAVNFDSSNLTLVAVRRGNLVAAMQGWRVQFEAIGDSIDIDVAGPRLSSGSGDLVVLEFLIDSNAKGFFRLPVANAKLAGRYGEDLRWINDIGSANGRVSVRQSQPPAKPASPSPIDGASDVVYTTALDWADSADAATYDVWLWKSNEAKPTTPTATGLAASAYQPLLALELSTTYSWQVVARNGDGAAPGDVWSFTVSSPIRTLTRLFYNTVLGRAPEEGAVDAWETGYRDSIALDIDVRFILREMGRLFFLSDEYKARQRSDANFIIDCYQAFLLRTPSQAEIDTWTSDVTSPGGEVRWNRGEVMTMFAESEEFADLVVSLFPGRSGNRTRNFVTTMYIGVFDRLVDSGGLLYWSGIMNGREDKQQGAVFMAEEFFNSPEGLQKAPTNELRVVRLYRAFLGRFPATGEIAYWAGELDNGNQNLAKLIARFAKSDEFARILSESFD